MVNKTTLNMMSSFLSHFERRGAVADTDGTLLWSNNSDLFSQEAVLEQVKEAFPIEKETLTVIYSDGETIPFFFIPHYRSKKIVGCYLLIERSSENALLCEEYGRTIKYTLSCLRGEISNVISINNLMMTPLKNGTADDEQMLSYLERQSGFTDRALMIYLNAKILSDVCLNEEYPPEISDIVSLTEELCDEIKRNIGVINREISISLADVPIFVSVNTRLFTLAFVNAFHNAILYSPKNTEISVRVEKIESVCSISIENHTTNGNDDGIYYDSVGIGRRIMKRVIENNYRGKCIFNDGTEKSVTTFMLPSQKKEKSNLVLSSSTSEYFSERFKPVQLFMNDAVRRDSEK